MKNLPNNPIQQLASETKAETDKISFLTSMNQMVASTPENISEMRKRARDEVYLLPNIALAGQLTIINAAYSTGKTLLAMWLLSQRNKAATQGFTFYYINADDDFNGGITKSELLELHHVHTLIPNERGFSVSHFTGMINQAIETKAANQMVFVLDTMKKFVNMMDKGGAREFTDLLRRFSQAGGSVIALAHTNKHKGSDGLSVAEGVGDFLSDFDCGYIADIATEDNQQKTVVFRNDKTRGTNDREITFTYSNIEGCSWSDKFDSVTKQSGCDAKRLLAGIEARGQYEKDLPAIRYIEARLSKGKVSRANLERTDLSEGKPSKNERSRVLDRYNQSNSDPNHQHWVTTSGTNGGKSYSLSGLVG